jgi:hypothetical protein
MEREGNMHGLPHILARGGGDYGGLVVAAIVIIGWVVKAISEALKQVSAQSSQRINRPPPVLQTQILPGQARPPMKKVQAAGKRKIAAPVKIAPPPLPAPPTRPAISPAQASPTAARPASAKLQALRRRVVWAEVLGKPVALREDHLR